KIDPQNYKGQAQQLSRAQKPGSAVFDQGGFYKFDHKARGEQQNQKEPEDKSALFSFVGFPIDVPQEKKDNQIASGFVELRRMTGHGRPRKPHFLRIFLKNDPIIGMGGDPDDLGIEKVSDANEHPSNGHWNNNAVQNP